MTFMSWTFDALLSATLLWLTWQTLASPDLFKAVVIFMAFGLLMALAWVRLHAPDIALAEAALGAGLMGALLLSTLGYMGGREPENGLLPQHEGETHRDDKNG